jgi:E3 ubiquitin-protein ligase SspH2
MSHEERAAFSLERSGPSFIEWLDRMKETNDHRNEATSAVLELQLTQLVDDMRADANLRATCFDIAFEALATCQDRVALAFNDMHTAALVARTQRPGTTERAVIDIGVDMFLLDLVNEHAKAKINALDAAARARGIPRNNAEDVETMLFFQVGLRAALQPFGINVPVPVQAMAYAGSAGVSPAELAAAADQIRKVFETNEPLKAYLATWSPLVKFVETNNANKFSELQASFHERLEALDKRLEDLGTPNESTESESQANESAANESQANESAKLETEFEQAALMQGLASATAELNQALVSDVLNRSFPPAAG